MTTILDHLEAQRVTKLPVAGAFSAQQAAPQYDPVTWALHQGRKLVGEPHTATLVLVAYAQHARAALMSPNGYTNTKVAEVATLLKISESTVRRYAKMFVGRGLLIERDDWLGRGHRLPEQAMNGIVQQVAPR